MIGLLFTLLLMGANVPSAPLTGTVVDFTGGVLAGARVVLVSAATKPAPSTLTDANGAFVLPDVALPARIEVSFAGFVTRVVSVTASPVTVRLDLQGEVGPTVQVSASILRHPISGATELNRDDIARVPAVTPDETLKVISGFSLFRRSTSRASNPTTHGVTMRGLSASGSSRALVLVDGVPLNDGFGGWVTWERLPAAAIDSVVVQRGPMGEIFGSDALGGVIELRTPSAAPASPVAGTAEWGSFDTRSFGVSGGAGSRARVFGAASWFDTNGFVPLAPASRGAVDAAQDTTWTNLYGRATFGQQTRITFSGWGGRDRRGNGTVRQRNASRGGTGVARLETATHGFQFSGFLSASANRYEQTFTAVAANRATERLTSTQHIDTNVGRLGATLLKSIAIGYIEARYSASGAGSDFTDTRPTTALAAALNDGNDAVSVQAAIDAIPRVTITGGVRGEWRAAGVAGTPAETDRKHATVGRLAASVMANNALSFRGAVASSHRWPTLNELVRDFSAGSTTTLANPNLLPERARSIEGGVDIHARRQQLSVTAFRSVVLDAVANVTTSIVGGAITRQRRNAGEAHSYGVEVDAEMHAASYLRLRASVTALNAKFRNSQEAALEGNWLPQVPATSIAVTADVFVPGPGHHVASVVVHDSSSQFDDDRNQFRLAAGTQVDAQVSGSHRLRRRSGTLGWRLAVENLGDARIETGRTPLVAFAQGRTVRFGASIGF